MDFSSMSQADIDAISDEQLKALSKEEKKALKARKRALWEAANGDKLKEKKPKMTKAERRASQAAQRAAKGQTASGGKAEGKAGGDGATGTGAGDSKANTRAAAQPASGEAKASAHPGANPGGVDPGANPDAPAALPAFRAAALFSHLPQHASADAASAGLGVGGAQELHPVIMQLGLKYASGHITNPDARVMAMLQAFRALVEDYNPPTDQEMSRHLLKRLERAFGFLTSCRPHTPSMGNIMRSVKQVVAKLPDDADKTDAEKKAKVLDRIDDISSRLLLAAQQIARIGAKRISDGDVVLTFGYTYAVELLLREAASCSYRLVIVDARPLHEGRHLMKALNAACPNLSITFVCFTGLSYALGDVNKVVLGADALMSNGAAIGRAGTAAVATAARARHIPVILACETYKLCRRVQLDAIVSNELGDPLALLQVAGNGAGGNSGGLVMPGLNRYSTGDEGIWCAEVRGSGVDDVPGVDRLNPLFDLTPIQGISLVVTEAGFMPPTSAPVLLRERDTNEM